MPQLLHFGNGRLTHVENEYVLSSSINVKRVSLLRWYRHATTSAFCEDRLLEIETDLVEKLYEFEENC